MAEVTGMELTGIERAHLHALQASDGFKVIQKIFRDEVEKFHLALLNTNPADEKAVIAAFQMEKAAAQIYVGITNRINSEIELHRNTPKSGEVQPDVTENLQMDGTMQDLLNNIPEEEFN